MVAGIHGLTDCSAGGARCYQQVAQGTRAQPSQYGRHERGDAVELEIVKLETITETLQGKDVLSRGNLQYNLQDSGCRSTFKYGSTYPQRAGRLTSQSC